MSSKLSSVDPSPSDLVPPFMENTCRVLGVYLQFISAAF